MMRSWTLSELAAPLEGRLSGGDATVHTVSTDSRSINEGALFVALQGENFDGHRYVREVEHSGAVAALISSEVDSAMPLLRVADTQRALGKLGAYNRQSFDGTLVAITGSCGKTTVKNMVAAVLSQRGETLVTAGNLNNEIGVPLTLLRLSPEHQFAVVEMGAARRGDIAWLCELGRPSIALLLNAMPAHLEGFGSVAEVASAKAEIFDQLSVADTAVINADETWAQAWRERAKPATILEYGLVNPAPVSAKDIETDGVRGVSFTAVTPLGSCRIQLALAGMHSVSNALAAICVGLACELSLEEIRRGLESVTPTGGRLAAHDLPTGVTVIDDCYNANPGSVHAAIEVLASCQGRRTLILGTMRELGAGSAALHREIGAAAKSAGLDQFWGVGAQLDNSVEAFGKGGRYFADREAALTALRGAFTKGDTVLIKGSRGAAMEMLLKEFVAVHQGGQD